MVARMPSAAMCLAAARLFMILCGNCNRCSDALFQRDRYNVHTGHAQCMSLQDPGPGRPDAANWTNDHLKGHVGQHHNREAHHGELLALLDTPMAGHKGSLMI